MANSITHALSPKQERKLLGYVDEKFLNITRNFKKRSDTSSTLQTLSLYLNETHTLLALILQIPPIDPSASLRITLLLRLTGEVMDSIPGYIPDTETLPQLLDWLDDLDHAWLTVLRSQVWNVLNRTGKDIVLEVPPDGELTLSSSPMNQTERTRLKSLLITGTARLEEWLARLDTEEESFEAAFERLGLQQGFDDLFTGTLTDMGALGGSVNNPEGMMGTC